MAERFHLLPWHLDDLTATEWRAVLMTDRAPVAAARPKPRTVAEFKAMQGGGA